jgi:ceramide glucosyltransferase
MGQTVGPFASRLALGLLFVSLVSLAYLAFAIVRTRRFARRARPPCAAGAPVTVLKPVCGEEPLLYENLRSFCDQDYPRFEVVFGVRDPGDPAIAVVERVMRDFPDLDLQLVVDDRVYGGNRKVSNLANIYHAAKYGVLVIADSDIRVGPGYLAAVTAPLSDLSVGVVTCLYAGRSTSGLWSTLGAMSINEWFIPSVLVAQAGSMAPFCFGSTVALHRHVLDEIGGFPALAGHLADDYVLGRLVAARGRRIALSPYVVEAIVAEPSLRSLWQHELRWARTVRSVQPLGYSLSFVTYAIPIAVLHLVLSPSRLVGGLVLAAAVVLRLAAHDAARRALGTSVGKVAWLVPVRDGLSFAVWAVGFFCQAVHWRGQEIAVGRGGRLGAERIQTP